MELKIKDPGSALTHFIAMLTAMVAATPLFNQGRIRPRNHAPKGPERLHRQHDPALRRKHGLPHLRHF